jgi:TetR/AcrR family transcriptional regulator, cholesterol catabolism regulator
MNRCGKGRVFCRSFGAVKRLFTLYLSKNEKNNGNDFDLKCFQRYLCDMFSEQQEKWLKRVEDLFLRLGIKSITMDDVARELGISKKTLYTFVESKDDLVKKVLERHILQEKNECMQMFSAAKNAVEELFYVIESNTQQMSQMKSNIVHDLQKYHREAWEMMSEYQRGFLYEQVSANLERGIKEGLYRDDINVDIVTRIHIGTSFQLFDETIFPQKTFRLDVIFKEYFLHYLHGILSEKGRKFFQKHAAKISP